VTKPVAVRSGRGARRLLLILVALVGGVALALGGFFIGRSTAPAPEPVSPPMCGDIAFPYADMTKYSQYFKEVCWLVEHGLAQADDEFLTTINDDGSVNFNPQSSLTRAEAAGVLYRYVGSPDFDPPAASPFKDVTPNDLAYREITWMASKEYIVTKDKDGKPVDFRPNNATTRSAMAIWLYRLKGAADYNPPATSPFDDVTPKTSNYKAICWLVDQGIVPASGDFNPTGPVTHQLLAVYLSRLG
jgi:hypothetical protein